jgi:hypothetical protein
MADGKSTFRVLWRITINCELYPGLHILKRFFLMFYPEAGAMAGTGQIKSTLCLYFNSL